MFFIKKGKKSSKKFLFFFFLGGGGVSTDFIKYINHGSIAALTLFLTARGGYCKRIGIKGSSSLMFWNFFFRMGPLVLQSYTCRSLRKSFKSSWRTSVAGPMTKKMFNQRNILLVNIGYNCQNDIFSTNRMICFAFKR